MTKEEAVEVLLSDEARERCPLCRDGNLTTTFFCISCEGAGQRWTLRGSEACRLLGLPLQDWERRLEDYAADDYVDAFMYAVNAGIIKRSNNG